MNERNIIIKSLFKLFSKELSEKLGIILTMNTNEDNNEIYNVNINYENSYIIDKNHISLQIQNTQGQSFISSNKSLLGKNIFFNDYKKAKIIEHSKIFDYTKDIIIVEGDFYNLDNIENLKSSIIKNSDSIYLYVQNGKLPSNSPFNRRNGKKILLYFSFQIVSKDDIDHSKIEEYTSIFEHLYYQEYNKSFPIEYNNKIITYTTSGNYDMNIQDYIAKSDDAIVRIITIPILTTINFY